MNINVLIPEVILSRELCMNKAPVCNYFEPTELENFNIQCVDKKRWTFHYIYSEFISWQ